MSNFIDVPYKLLKEAVERIEKKKGTCKFLPCARFEWSNPTIHTGLYDMYKVHGNMAGIRLTTLVCDEDKMGGKNTGTAAEHCKNCIISACEHKKTVKTKCPSYPNDCDQEYHQKCLKCGTFVDLLGYYK